MAIVAFRAIVLALISIAVSAQTFAQSQPPVTTTSGGVIQGVVSTQNGTIPLGGVMVSLSSDRTSEVLTAMSEGDGTYRFAGLEAGDTACPLHSMASTRKRS